MKTNQEEVVDRIAKEIAAATDQPLYVVHSAIYSVIATEEGRRMREAVAKLVEASHNSQ